MPSRLERDIEEILHRLEERPTRRTPRWLRRLRFSFSERDMGICKSTRIRPIGMMLQYNSLHE